MHITQTFNVGLFQSQECDIFDRSDFTKPLQLHATIMEYETKTQMTETHVQVVWIDIDKKNNETLDARKFESKSKVLISDPCFP